MASIVAGGLFNALAFLARVIYFKNLTKTDTVRRQEDTISLWKNSRKRDKNGIKKTSNVKKRWRLYVENAAMRTQILKTRH